MMKALRKSMRPVIVAISALLLSNSFVPSTARADDGWRDHRRHEEEWQEHRWREEERREHRHHGWRERLPYAYRSGFYVAPPRPSFNIIIPLR